MIYTITFNPSLDYVIQVDRFKTGCINKTVSEDIFPGGKGINVSILLSNLGFKSVSLGYLAGFTGVEIQKRLREFGCTSDFIFVKEGLSRINIKMKSCDETEINGKGPKILEDNIQQLFNKIDDLEDNDVLVISGSVPNTLPDDIYERILERLKNKQVQIVVDATGQLMINSLKYHPFLIKPNIHELSELFGKELCSKDDVVLYAKELQKLGAKNVLVSMGGDGAVLISENGAIYKQDAPKGTVVNSVGSGDSMVAGFIAGYLETQDFSKAFIQGVASGSATAFATGIATKEEIEEVMKTLYKN